MYMKIDEKLSHLSSDEIEKVVSLYKDKSIKISDIIKKYNIDVKPSGLLKILPPKKTDKYCPYCKIPMFQKMEGRTTYSYSRDEDKFCDMCGHIEYADKIWDRRQCTCTNCTEMKEALIQEKREQIQRIYGKNNKKIRFEEISLQEQLDLIYLMRNNPNLNTYEIAPIQLIVLKEQSWLKKLNRLLENQLIDISPNTEINAFEKEDFPYTVKLLEATLRINVEFSEDDLEKINANTYFAENVSEEDKIEILKDYIYDDAIVQFSKMLEERNLELIILDKANENFKLLIEKISYTQLIKLCFKVARFYSDKVVTRDMSRTSVNKAVLTSVNTFYENAVENGWTLNHSEYEYVGDELNNYVTVVLGKKLELLRYAPSVENMNKVEDVEKDYTNKKKHYKRT